MRTGFGGAASTRCIKRSRAVVSLRGDQPKMKRVLGLGWAIVLLSTTTGCLGLCGALTCCDDYCFDGSCPYGSGGCGSCGSGGGASGCNQLACQQGCGRVYWGEFSDRPDKYDPCDRCGNWTGRPSGCGSTYNPLGASGHYHGYDDGGWYEGGAYDGAISDVHWSEGRPATRQPTPAKPQQAEPLPSPRSSSKYGRPPQYFDHAQVSAGTPVRSSSGASGLRR